MTVVDPRRGRILHRVEDSVGWITFANPTRRNALSLEMVRTIPRVLRELEDDDDVKVIVLRGHGDEAFVSGADISEFASFRTAADARAVYDAALAETWSAWRAVEKPMIAMIAGFCVGGGLVTALHADVRIASDEAVFAVPAARLGLGYEYQHVVQLLDTIGPAWTSELLFTARRVAAEEALEIGLLNYLVPPTALEERVRSLAATIAANASLTVRAAKIAIREARRDESVRDVERVDALVRACFESSDYREGQQAFLEKRRARFQGR
jgi:enoyl-CoA hydratase